MPSNIKARKVTSSMVHHAKQRAQSLSLKPIVPDDSSAVLSMSLSSLVMNISYIIAYIDGTSLVCETLLCKNIGFSIVLGRQN